MSPITDSFTTYFHAKRKFVRRFAISQLLRLYALQKAYVYFIQIEIIFRIFEHFHTPVVYIREPSHRIVEPKKIQFARWQSSYSIFFVPHAKKDSSVCYKHYKNFLNFQFPQSIVTSIFNISNHSYPHDGNK